MRYLFYAFCLPFLFACTPETRAPVVLEDVVITEPRPGANMSAGYFTISNNRGEPLAITRVESPQFGKIEIHETTTIDGVSRMRPIPALEVPAGGSIVLERGGKHLMLMQPAADLERISLDFYAADELLVSIDTEIAADRGP